MVGKVESGRETGIGWLEETGANTQRGRTPCYAGTGVDNQTSPTPISRIAASPKRHSGNQSERDGNELLAKVQQTRLEQKRCRNHCFLKLR